MVKLPRAECRSCGAPSRYFALHCRNCRAINQPNPVATVAALLAVVCMGAAAAVATALLREQPARQAASERADVPANPSPKREADYGWLMEAMAKCEAEAKQQLETLHFLIVPVTQTGASLPGWSPSPIGNVGGSAKLLSATDALLGLRNRVLVLYAKPLTFLIADPTSKTMYKWQPAVGVAALNTREASFGDVTLGFEMPDAAEAIEWGPSVTVSKGTCYWINLLVLARAK